MFPELPAGSPQEAGRRARAQGACMCAYRVAPSGHGAEGRRRGRDRDHLCVSVTRSEGRGVRLSEPDVGAGVRAHGGDPSTSAVLNEVFGTKRSA